VTHEVRRGFLVIAVAIALTPRLARAQSTDAEAMFGEGERLEAAGRIAEACNAFASSNRIEPRAGTLIRLGMCREQQGHLATAWSAYKDALTRVKDPEKRRFAEDKVAALEGRMSTLTVRVPDGSRIDGLVIERNGSVLDAGLWNRALPVDGGVYTIGGSAPGHEQWTTTVEIGNERDHASVDVPRFAELRVNLVETHDVVQPRNAFDAADAPPRPAGGLTRRRKAALGLGSAGVVAIGTGVVLALGARGLVDEAYGYCPDPTMPCPAAPMAQSLLDRARTREQLARITGGVGAVAVLGAGFLWVTGASRVGDDHVAVTPLLGAGVAGVDVQVRY
jgi:hypothetical protein